MYDLRAEYDYILNLVDPDLVTALDEYLSQPRDVPATDMVGLNYPSRVFYDLYPDEYDFLVFFSAHHVSGEIGGGHIRVNSPAIPGTGVDHYRSADWYGDAGRLMSVIGVDSPG